MRPLSLVGTTLLFAGCLTEPAETVAEGEPCEEEGAGACADDTTDDAGYLCVDGAWAAQADCECSADRADVICVDTAIGFTGVTRARAGDGAPRAKARRVRLA